jgi:hypothetical protein
MIASGQTNHREIRNDVQEAGEHTEKKPVGDCGQETARRQQHAHDDRDYEPSSKEIADAIIHSFEDRKNRSGVVTRQFLIRRAKPIRVWPVP